MEARSSIPGEVVPSREWYDYEEKYVTDGAQLLVPARLSEAEAADTQLLALRTYRAAGCDGYARVDFLLDKANGKVWVNEINTIPGFTSISMYPRLWNATGLPMKELVTELIALADERYRSAIEQRDRQVPPRALG